MIAKFVTLAICGLLLTQPAIAIPDDVFKVRPEVFAYANDPDVFDNITEGITIEAWIYLNEKPEDRVNDRDKSGKWIIFGKPGSYFVSISGRNLGHDIERRMPGEFAMIEYWIETNKGIYLGQGESIFPESYLQNWVHIALQIVPNGNEVDTVLFYNQKLIGNKKAFSSMKREDSPFMLGGPTFAFGRKYSFESMDGYIDEVRVSKGMRFGQGKNIRVERPFDVDEQTIALWDFEEGANAYSYQDASGNGYSLSLGGVLSVDPDGKLPTAWGRIKKQVSF